MKKDLQGMFFKKHKLRTYRNSVTKGWVKNETDKFRFNCFSGWHVDGPRAVLSIMVIPVTPVWRVDIPGASSKVFSTLCMSCVSKMRVLLCLR